MVQEKELVARRAKVRQPARYSAAGLCKLIGINEVKLRSAADFRRADCSFPSADPCAGNGKWKENIGIFQHVVIEVVARVRLKICNVKNPSGGRNGQSEFSLLVALAVKRQKTK